MGVYKTAEELREELDEKRARLNVLENNENTDEYDEMLDEAGPVEVAGLTFNPSQIVKEMDPTAYRCGMNDHNDSEISDLTEEIKDLEEALTIAEQEENEAAK